MAGPSMGTPNPVPSGGHSGPSMGGPMAGPMGVPLGAPPSAIGEPLPATAPGVMPPGVMPPAGSPSGPRAAEGSMITCPRCGTPTPVGFAYCQQCGLYMQALQPTDPGQAPAPRGRPPSVPGAPPPSVGTPPNARPSGGLGINIDVQAATMAASGPDTVRAGSIGRPATAASPSWGTAVLVNRDGSDGQRYPLASEYIIVGRAGADIAFADDRFLAREHARIARAGDGSVKVEPLDQLNGVFRKADAPVELVDGMTILVGREVLRYEKIEPEEIKVHPLVRHGVALFGSPPREPWGRFMQIVPSGGYRDVRHLAGEEIVLGREEGDIVFRDDAFMSRRHAAVTWNGRTAQVTDLGSSNGTFVRITGPTPIKHGDHVRMGDQLLRIELGR
jgi:pSer/pThr/pTyr-binding forkhead associated (FHA) protein